MLCYEKICFSTVLGHIIIAHVYILNTFTVGLYTWIIISNIMKWGELAVKPDAARWRSFSKIPKTAGPSYSFHVILCLSTFLYTSKRGCIGSNTPSMTSIILGVLVINSTCEKGKRNSGNYAITQVNVQFKGPTSKQYTYILYLALIRFRVFWRTTFFENSKP